jgi:fructoselysine 6-kinase
MDVNTYSTEVKMKVACFTVACMDYFPQQKKYFAGGNALNQSIRFKRLGNETAFIGAVGADVAGKDIERLLKKNQVDVSHLYLLAGITACNQIMNDEEGERFGVEGAWKNGVYGDFVLSEFDWQFIKTYEVWSTHATGENYEASIQQKNKNNFLVVDYLHFDTYELLEIGKGKVDIAYFGGTENQYEELLRFSKEFQSLIVLTCGSGGSYAFEKGIPHFQKALPVDKVIDTTGCGDAYQAGFTNEFYQSRDVEKALIAGAEMGRMATQNWGGVPW